MSGSKKRSGFQITSITPDLTRTPVGQSAPSVVLPVVQSEPSSLCGPSCSSQPTAPSLKKKYISHDAPVQGPGFSSRFRVVRLSVGGAGGSGRAQPYHRGRWTCMDVMERQERAGFRRVMDTMRHAHSLESLEMIGRDRAYSGNSTHLLSQSIRGKKGVGLVLRSGPPSPTFQEPINIQLLDQKQPIGMPSLNCIPPPPSPRPRNIPPPLRLDVDAAGRSVLRQTHSQPNSPPAGSYHSTLTPIRDPAVYSLDRTIFNLAGDNSSSGNSLGAIDNRIEQAMDLVKSHLIQAVREELELLREQIRGLQEKNQKLERENRILRTLMHNRATDAQQSH